jgi:hypothetical protein
MAEQKFKCNVSAYSRLIADSHGVSDLVEDIDAAEYKNTAFHGRTRIRKGGSFLSLYDTHSIAEWVKRRETHPETREDISYMKAHIIAKEKWSKLFSTVTPVDVTPEFKACILRKLMCGTTENPDTPRAFLDLDTLDKEKCVLRVSFVEARCMMTTPGDWMIRQSSIHNGVPPNCQVFVLGFCRSDGAVIQSRFLDVVGVGIVPLNGNAIPSEVNQALCASSYVCITDLLENFMNRNGLLWVRLIRPS